MSMHPGRVGTTQGRLTRRHHRDRDETLCPESKQQEGFPGGAVVKNPPANAGDAGLIPGPGRSHMPRSN